MNSYYSLKPGEKEKIIANIKNILADRSDILFAYIHGSFLSAPSFRDIDVAVFVEPSVYRQRKDDIAYELELGAGIILSYPLDLRTLNSAPFVFQNAVARSGRLLFCRDETALAAMIEYSSQAMLDYLSLMKESYAALAA